MEVAVPEQVRALYDKMQDAMLPLVKQHTVAIAALQNGELRQHATGTLVQFSDRYFVVTAAHVIEDYHKAKESCPDLRLFIDNGNSELLVSLDGRYDATQTVRDNENPRLRFDGERDDIWDIGLWELGRNTVESLTNKTFLNRASISITDDLTTGIYFLLGFPCSWAHTDTARGDLHWGWLQYIAHPYPDRDGLPNFDDRFHTALSLVDDPRLPKGLEGISGCAIWKLTDLPLRDDWNADEAKVVAVETCVYKQQRAIRGTKWQWVGHALARTHPEIVQGLKLWLPGTPVGHSRMPHAACRVAPVWGEGT